MLETTNEQELKQKELINKVDVLRCVKETFRQEHETLKQHPINEQLIIGNKLTIIESELKKWIKALPNN